LTLSLHFEVFFYWPKQVDSLQRIVKFDVQMNLQKASYENIGQRYKSENYLIINHIKDLLKLSHVTDTTDKYVKNILLLANHHT
jgi:hypothetical protein